LGVNDVFVEHGSQVIIRKKYGLDAEGIVVVVREMVGDRQKVVAGGSERLDSAMVARGLAESSTRRRPA